MPRIDSTARLDARCSDEFNIDSYLVGIDPLHMLKTRLTENVFLLTQDLILTLKHNSVFGLTK